MKKLTYLILLALIIPVTLLSQPCLPEGITFSTQEQIDNFQTNYPNSTEIEGGVTISGIDITNLNGLSVLTSIGGTLNCSENDILTNFNGLNAITSIGGLEIGSNAKLTSFTGLDSLSYVEGDCRIHDNPSLPNLTGLQNLDSIGGFLILFANNSLINLIGLDNLTSIGGELGFSRNDALTSLSGLENLTSVGKDLIFGWSEVQADGNPSLVSLTALNNLTSIGGMLSIYDNDSLASLTGLGNIEAESITEIIIKENPVLSICDVNCICDYLAAPNGEIEIHNNAPGCDNQGQVEDACEVCLPEGITFSSQKQIDSFQINYPYCSEIEGNVEISGNDITDLSSLSQITFIAGDLDINNNDSLTSLWGLENIYFGSIIDISIVDNTVLSECEIRSVCEYLANPGGTIEISNNAPGCNDQQEVEDACASHCLYDGFIFTTQAQIDSFQINYPTCTQLEGDVEISGGDDIYNLNGLDTLISIGGNLFISNNDSLSSITGLNNLTSIDKDLYIEKNDALTSLSGLENITYVAQSLSINDNPSLATLTGLENITSIDGSMEISNNETLANLSGLDNLNFIGGDILISGNYAMTNLTGLENMTSIDGSLGISFNEALTNLSGLDNVTFIGGTLSIGEYDYWLGAVGGNMSLTSLAGLENLSFIEGDLIIGDNTSLTNLTGLDSLTSIKGYFSIAGNDSLTCLTGTNSLSTVGGINIGWRFYKFLYKTVGNPSLTNLASLENISSLEGDLVICDNQSLTNLIGLDSLTSIGGDLFIYANDSLSACDVQSVCSYLVNPNGSISISNNAAGCNSQEEVEESCGITSVEEAFQAEKLLVYPNPFTTSTTIQYKLTQPETVTITFYNHFGSQVDMIEERQQKGLNKIVWNPKNLTNGVYYFRFQSGVQVASGKVVLMK